MANVQRDRPWGNEFFNFTRGRFVCQEKTQMATRHIQFDIDALCEIAANAVSARTCVNATKCPDGLYNKAFILTMDNGREVIAKVPNPNAGIRNWTTASEAATMAFAREVLRTPAPKVYAWSCNASSNPVGAEYIVMEKMTGIPLQMAWEKMELSAKLKVVLQIHKFQQSWLSFPFGQIGSLYFRENKPGTLSGLLKGDEHGRTIEDERFAIGPILGRDWTDDGRASLGCDRGPWKLASEYYKSIVDREILATTQAPVLPKQMTMVCGPRLYSPTRLKKQVALHDFTHVVDTLLPMDGGICTPYLWHNDLHAENIFVDEAEPTRITGIIDWQSARIAPLFEHTMIPGILDYDGPEVEGFDKPELPANYSELPREERAELVKLQFSQALVVAYRRLVKGKSREIHDAIEFQKTSAYTMLHISRRIFSIGEAHLRALLTTLNEEWGDLPAVSAAGSQPPSFPLKYSASEVEDIELDAEAADIGIQLMNDLKTLLGQKWPDHGAVRHEDYKETKSLLKEEKQRLQQKLELNEQEVEEFDKFWPFDD